MQIKVKKKIKFEPYSLDFPLRGTINDLAVFTNASLAKFPDQISSGGGYIILLTGCGKRCCVLPWSRRKIRRVGKSTSSVVVLNLIEATEEAIYPQAIVPENFVKKVLSKFQSKHMLIARILILSFIQQEQ